MAPKPVHPSKIKAPPTWIAMGPLEGHATPPWERKLTRWQRFVRWLTRLDRP